MVTKRAEVLHKLRLELPELEAKRKSLLALKRRKLSMLMVPGGVLALLFVWWMVKQIGAGGLGVLAILIGLMVLVISEYLKYFAPRWKKELQESIGGAILKQLYPSWTFKASNHLPLGAFRELGVVQGSQNWDGSNLIAGKYGDTTFSFCHLHVYYQDKDGNSPPFNGLLLVFDFHKLFKGKTLVVRDQAQKILGSYMGKKVQEFGWRGLELVYLEDPIFERFFAVYGDSQITSRYILTLQMMQSLIQLRQRYGEEIFFSFVEGKIAVAINHVYLYQNNIESPIHLEASLDQFLKPVEIVKDVIDTLQLNTRIWGKE